MSDLVVPGSGMSPKEPEPKVPPTHELTSSPHSDDGHRGHLILQYSLLTRHFRIHTNPPIKRLQRAHHVQVRHTDLLDALDHLPRLGVGANPDLAPLAPSVGAVVDGVEGVGDVAVLVADGEVVVGGEVGVHAALAGTVLDLVVEEDVVVFVLGLEGEEGGGG